VSDIKALSFEACIFKQAVLGVNDDPDTVSAREILQKVIRDTVRDQIGPTGVCFCFIMFWNAGG
jgi:hypothetical protein